MTSRKRSKGVRNANLATGLFVGGGVEIIVNCGQDPSWVGWAGGLAACIMVLESHTHGSLRDNVINVFAGSGNEYLKRMDIVQGDRRSLFEFFKQRINCGCLDELYTDVRSQRKTGTCETCKQRIERRQLLVCSNCLVCQYCSHECRLVNWKDHKDWCRDNPAPCRTRV